MASRIALVTAVEARALDEDLPPLIEALRALGVEVDTPCWDDPGADWSRYDAAVIRSTWDYADRIGEFLGWTERADARTLLFNPPAVLRWSTDKHYLRDLAGAGVPVVPTRFVEPGEVAEAALAAFLAGGGKAFSVGRACDCEEFVIKPAVGAGSRDAARYRRHEVARATSHLGRLLAGGRSAMLQPYLPRVDEEGETALVYVDGHFSHAIRKDALLRPGGAFVTGLFAPEKIAARQPAADELAVAAAACAAIVGGAPLYARIDLIRDGQGLPVVLELELAEPSLFFTFAPGSARLFARAILQRLASAATSAR
jgi:glutathione synthase/RimK-type ligase-like ATP-grasp enzyme